MKEKNSLQKQITWAVVFAIGFYSGHISTSWWYLLVGIITYFLFGYFIAFVFWVLRGWKIGKVENKKADKYNWHNKTLK
jgi:hypothetical protein